MESRSILYKKSSTPVSGTRSEKSRTGDSYVRKRQFVLASTPGKTRTTDIVERTELRTMLATSGAAKQRLHGFMDHGQVVPVGRKGPRPTTDPQSEDKLNVNILDVRVVPLRSVSLVHFFPCGSGLESSLKFRGGQMVSVGPPGQRPPERRPFISISGYHARVTELQPRCPRPSEAFR